MRISVITVHITHLPIRLHVHGSFGREYVRSVTKAEVVGLKPSAANEIPFPSTVEGGPLERGQGPSGGSRTAALDISAAPIINKSIALFSSSKLSVSWTANARTFRQPFWAVKEHLWLAVLDHEGARDGVFDFATPLEIQFREPSGETKYGLKSLRRNGKMIDLTLRK